MWQAAACIAMRNGTRNGIGDHNRSLTLPPASGDERCDHFPERPLVAFEAPDHCVEHHGGIDPVEVERVAGAIGEDSRPFGSSSSERANVIAVSNASRASAVV